MIFKPRIFIGSTFKENKKSRSDLEVFFESIGAEPMLYEYNLTPSVQPSTYRKDVAEAGFVIMIIKNDYGKKTERGTSESSEELKIALTLNLSLHVYYKNDSKIFKSKSRLEPEIEVQKFKGLIDDNRISYYRFNDDLDLLKRIKETTFKIANEIVMRKLSKMALDRGTVVRMKGNHDYLQAIGVIKIIDYLKKMSGRLDPIDTNLLGALEYLFEWIKENDWIFIDNGLRDDCKAMEIQISNFFVTHLNDYITRDSIMDTIEIPMYGDVVVSPLTRVERPRKQRNEYIAIINKFFKTFEKFKKRVGKIKLSADTFLEGK